MFVKTCSTVICVLFVILLICNKILSYIKGKVNVFKENMLKLSKCEVNLHFVVLSICLLFKL